MLPGGGTAGTAKRGLGFLSHSSASQERKEKQPAGSGVLTYRFADLIRPDGVCKVCEALPDGGL